MEAAKMGALETASRASHRVEVGKTRPVDVSVLSGNLSFSGKSFYLDLPHNRSSQILTGTIKKLGGVIESFLSREVMYVVSASKEAQQINGTVQRMERKSNVPTITRGVTKAKPVLSAIPVGITGLDAPCRPKPENHPTLISRGKELLHKAMRKKDGSPSVLANARSWGVHILHVNEVLDCVEKLSLASKSLSSQKKTEVAAPRSVGKARKVAQLKSPFLKIEDQSRQFRPLHHHFQSFPELNVLAGRGFSLFELTKSTRSSRKDPGSKAKAVNAEFCPAHSEAEPRSPEIKPTPEDRSPKTKPIPATKKRRNGYCECCQQAFEELATHLQGEQHLRFALDATQYALVDGIISQFPNDFAELQPYWSNSGLLAVPTSAVASVDTRCPKNDVQQMSEVKGSRAGLDTEKSLPTVDEEQKSLGDDLQCNLTCDERLKEGGETPTSDAAGGSLSAYPSLPPVRELSCTMEKAEGRKEISFRTLLESGKEQEGGNVEELDSQSNKNSIICSPDVLHFGKKTVQDAAAVCDTGLVSSAGEGVEACYMDSVVLGDSVWKLRPGCEDLVQACPELNEASSDRKRKRPGQQSPQAAKRRTVRPSSCSSGPVSPSNQQDDTLEFAVGETEPVHVVSSLEGALAGSMQTSVIERLVPFPTVPCNPATSLSVEAHHALPRDLQHYEQLLGHWECFSPRVDVHQGMPSEMTGCRDDWDTNPVTPSGHKPVERDLSFLCGIDVPVLNELSSTWCKVHRSGGQSVLQELQSMERQHCASSPSPSRFCSSGCSVGLTFQEFPKNISTEDMANPPCLPGTHITMSDVKKGTGLLPAESFSSVSDWDVQLLSRLDHLHGGKEAHLHGAKEAPLDMEVLQRTCVSMRDTSYESHLYSVLKPKCELDWVLKEERGHVNCWAETDGIPFNMFEACLNGLTS